MSKVLVIGGAGFLGSALVSSLVKNRNYEVQVLDTFSHGFPKKPVKKKNLAPPISGNVCNYYDVLRTVERFSPQIVVHLAAYNSRPEALADFRVCANVNYLGTANVLQACLNVRNRPKQLVFASALSAASPAMHYGVSKRAAEDLLQSVLPRFPELDVGLVVLRFAEIYGAGEPYSSLALPNFLTDHMLAGNNITLYGVNKQKDFLHLSDAVQACECAIRLDGAYKKLPIIDIGTGTGVPIKELVQKLKELTHFQGRLKFLDSDKVPVEDEVADTSPAATLLDFNSIVGLEEGLVDLVKSRRKARK